MTLRLVALLALTIGGLAFGCDTDTENAGQCTEASFTVATFNGGLARGDVPLVEERISMVVEEIAALDADLLCVQENWLDWDELVMETKETLPFAVRLPPHPDCANPKCSDGELTPLATCAQTHCDGVSPADLGGCAITYCATELGALSASCAACAVDNVGSGIDGILTACVGPTGAGPTYLYECAYDTGILTSADIVTSESRVLDSFLVAAAVDFARVSTPLGELDVYCTHLASEIDPFTYEGAHGDWKGEQMAQIQQLLGFVTDKSDGSRPIIVLGDLNTGPAVDAAGIIAKWREHYDALMAGAYGFEEPYLSQPDVTCTYCPDNNLTSDSVNPRLINHVLLSGFDGEVEVSRVCTDKGTVEVGGQLVETHPSDHYGLTATLTECVD